MHTAVTVAITVTVTTATMDALQIFARYPQTSVSWVRNKSVKDKALKEDFRAVESMTKILFFKMKSFAHLAGNID